ncbi:MAG: hypothetical protein ACR2N6_09650 [Miltoncostaeaceae bacterium]
MTPNRLQRFFLAVLPKRSGEAMRRDSQLWTARCLTCGRTRSVWEAGGIRWGARSVGKRSLVPCDRCGRPRMTAIERPPREV